MSALTEKQRKFVLAMASAPLDSAASWARTAGYSDRGERAKVTAHELIHNPAVEAAVLEVAKSMLGTVGPLLAARQLIKIASGPKHKHQMRAVEAIANRTGLPEVEQIEISHHHTLSGDALIARFTDVATQLGLDPAAVIGGHAELPKLIEAQAVALEELPQDVPDWCGLGKNAG